MKNNIVDTSIILFNAASNKPINLLIFFSIVIIGKCCIAKSIISPINKIKEIKITTYNMKLIISD